MSTKKYERWLAILSLAAWLVGIGCAKRADDLPPRPSTNQTADSREATATASQSAPAPVGELPPAQGVFPAAPVDYQAIQSIIAKYAETTSYADQGIVELTYRFQDGRTETNRTAFAVEFTRPNRIRLEIVSEDNRIFVVCDGQQLICRVVDPVTQDFDHQTVVRPAPAELSLDDIYSVTELIDPLVPSQRLNLLFGVPVGLEQMPIGLLLGASRLIELAQMPTRVERLSDHSLAVSGDEGRYVVIFDPESHRVVKISHPPVTQDLAPGLERIELSAAFPNASLGKVDDRRFTIAANDIGQAVHYFVLPPLPQPTPLLGKTICELQLQDAAGRPLRAILNDELHVLCWFHNHSASRSVVEPLEQLQRQLADRPIRFTLISVDPQQNARQVAQLLSDWSVTMPFGFDPAASGLDELGISQSPTTIVLDRQGKLHHFAVGANPNLQQELSYVLTELLRGIDIANQTQARLAESESAYRQQLQRAQSSPLTDNPPQVADSLPDAQNPEQMVLTPLWTNRDVVEPGNGLVVPGRTKSLLLLDGWDHFVKIDQQGSLAVRTRIELPDGEGIALLRAGTIGGSNLTLAGTARGARHAFLFDPQGRLTGQFPSSPDPKVTISDARPIDPGSESKSAAMAVAWTAQRGIEGVDPQGVVQWSNRALAEISTLDEAVLPFGQETDRPWVAAGPSGQLLFIDRQGRSLHQLMPGDLPIHQCFAWPGSARQLDRLVTSSVPLDLQSAAYCGLSFSPTGEWLAVGLNTDLKTVWKYALPRGVHRYQVDAVQTLPATDNFPACWLLAGPDGSVHVISADGAMQDRFYVGRHLRGLMGTKFDGQPVVIFATDARIDAFRLSLPE